MNVIDIPMDKLSPAALKGLLEAFVLREGTDYGEQEYSLESKVERVRKQLANCEASIVYNTQDESFDIIRT